MKRTIQISSVLVCLLVAVPDDGIAAVRISSSTIEACAAALPFGQGQSEIITSRRNRTEYRSNTFSIFSKKNALFPWRTVNIQTSGWAYQSTQTEYPFGIVASPDVRIVTTHFYQRQTCNFWEDWAEKYTQLVNCGVDIANPR